MATLPLPGQSPTPLTQPLDPDEVGYSARTPEGERRDALLSHTPETCQLEHCACHLPAYFNPPSMSLTSREAFVLAWHLFPLNDDSDEDLSFETIGKKLGVTETRVRQIYMRAAAKIRAHARVHYPTNPHQVVSETDPAETETEPTPS